MADLALVIAICATNQSRKRTVTRVAEYIERELAREKLCSMCSYEGTNNCEECEHPIDDIPAVDVCPHYHPNHHDRGDDSLCDRFMCEVKALPRWIPVTEQLPLLNTPVLATDGIEVDISWMYGVPPRWITSYTAIDEDKLTHWMPLPQTPKGEQDG